MPTVQGIVIFFLLSTLYITWLYQVNRTVSEPYLDEVFHVRQAQAYCAGKFRTWDPKITTPPGLYLLSYLFVKTKQMLFGGTDCGLADLRWLNILLASCVIPAQVWDLHSQLGHSRRSSQKDGISFHNVLNICLFPLLFFFSGLYYTDVCSVSLVLGAYEHHLRSLHVASSSRNLASTKVFIIGLYSLLLRQTNFFWAAVFLAGLHAVHHVKKIKQPPAKKSVGPVSVSKAIYDPPVSKAYLEDYIKTTLSLATAALTDPLSLLLSLWPYLALLASFFTFLLVNGGVVLGDKENHVASIHIPQMLYVWAYIMFFSWPVILPHIIHILTSESTSLRTKLPRPVVAIPLMAIMALAVHFNTIVHPFTLADNRHYVFYVFRLLLKTPPTKYAAVPIYYFCAWAAITALDNPPTPAKKDGDEPPNTIPDTQTTTSSEPAHRTRASFLLVFLTSTTLSLITAPLVEPRYFILPWLIWRLHVESAPPIQLSSRSRSTEGLRGLVVRMLEHRSTWLYLETAWFLLVNLVTCGMFLYRGFEWEQEPGRVQRFMW